MLRASFLLVMVGLPAVHIGIAALASLSLATSDSKPRLPVVVVDEHQLTEVAGADSVVRDKEAALRELSERRLDGVRAAIRLPAGRACRCHERPAADLLQIGKAFENRERAAVIRRGLSGQTDDRAARLVEPLVETTWRVQGATVERRVAPPLLDVFAGPFGMYRIMALSIFLASGSLQQSMSTELRIACWR